MDLLDELEAMAQAALVSQDDDDIPESATARWQKLFGYSAAMAETKITEHRNDPLRFTVSEDHWTVLRDCMEAEGQDYESYEHSCIRISRDAINQRQEMTMKEKRRLRASTVLVKLEGPLHSVQAVIQAAGKSSADSTQVLAATDLSGQPSSFSKINGIDKLVIERWLRENPYPGFTPTFIRDLNAPKDLSSTSFHPTLGLDTTLPQYRLGSDEIPRPAQNEYPAEYYAAKIRGGALKTWGRYNALVDDPSRTNLIHGKAPLVQTREEERLRAYETHFYEVVRWSIEMGSEEPANGLTFRLITDMMD
ncbi:hypothetical protein FOVG_03780 [Fusarium oxysporum f. sp. pisi HDV247]|uniref:Uncharacterized protein n=1 Tax=Fusarium oxysporum f. sp. pisi HDV247 TaxID=1080344 RepID=W9QIS3_FUSOX|nr:hypothetical protein FOVG_03780 [Fusarium oxysporum f. sp. pisi HDV247]